MLRLKLPRVLIIIFSPQTTNRTTSFRKVAPLKETTTQFCHNVSFGQTRTVKLSVGEKSLRICLLVSMQEQKHADKSTQTDRQGRI